MLNSKRDCSTKSYSLLWFFKRVLLFLVVLLFVALIFVENERKELPPIRSDGYWVQRWTNNLTNAKASNQSNISPTRTLPTTSVAASSTAVPSIPVLRLYDYKKTSKWGKQNETTWKFVYGDTSCADNPRRVSLTAILKKWVEIAKQNNIKYALMWGTLIGILRNNDVVPWDHDMDLLVEYKDILVLEKLGWPRDIHPSDTNTYINAIPSSEHNKSMDDRHRWNCQGKIVPNHVDICAIQEPLVRLYNNGAFLDVFYYYDQGDTIVSSPEGHKMEIKRQDFFPFRSCLFMGVETMCPNNPEKILAMLYGPDFLKSPKKCKSGRWL